LAPKNPKIIHPQASRILEGHFEPLLYIAMEYCHANNFKLATDFLHDAETVAGANAVVLNEQGNVAFMEHDFKSAPPTPPIHPFRSF
jgi:hypothetical protein